MKKRSRWIFAPKLAFEINLMVFFLNLLQEELLKFQANLKRQLELIRMNSMPRPSPHHPNNVPPTTIPMSAASIPMPMPSAPQMPYNRQNSNSSIAANEDGWVLVPSQTESDA